MIGSMYKGALEHFERISQAETQSWPDGRWHGQIGNCDICSRPMAGERFMIDGPASFQRDPPWGNLCVLCAHKYSPIVGWGRAQLYEGSEDGIWRLVAGGPPPEAMVDDNY